MGHLSAIGIVLAVIVAVMARLIADDIKAWIPRITDALIDRAVAKLPEDQRLRYAEEWRSHVNDVPGDLGKLFVAMHLVAAAGTMRRGSRLMVRIADVVMAALLVAIVAPFMVMVGFSLISEFSSRDLPILVRGLDGMLKFRTTDSDGQVTRLGRFLRAGSFDELPILFNVMKGDASIMPVLSRWWQRLTRR